MELLQKIWTWIDCNRFIVICPLVALVIWFAAASCEPLTESVLNPPSQITADQLKVELIDWQKQQEVYIMKFDNAGKDIEKQKEQMAALNKFILDLASGNFGNVQSAIIALIAGGGLGAIVDNIRKRSLISGLKITAKAPQTSQGPTQ